MNELYNETPEDQPEPLYTEEDTFVQPNTNMGKYPIMKGIATVATGNTEADEEVNFDTHVDQAWRSIAGSRNDIDRDVAEQAAIEGNGTLFQEVIGSVAKRNEMYTRNARELYKDTRAKIKELADEAVEKTTTNNAYVLINNSPEEIAQVTANVSTRLTAQSVLERAMEDGSKWSTIGTGFGFELLPFSAEQGAAIDRVAIKYGVPADAISRLGGRSKTITYLQAAFEAVPEELKGEWLDGLYQDLQDGFYISDWQAALVVQDVATNVDKTWGGWEDWLDRLGAVAIVATGALALLKGGKLLKSANQLKDMERTIAAAGGKNAIVSAEAAKITSALATKQRIQAAGVVLGEATGISAALDLTKLVSLSASKVLPSSITTAASDLQKPIRDAIDTLISDFQGVVSAKGIRSAEVAEEIDAIKAVYSPANNPRIHSVDNFVLSADGTSITGRVYYKPEGSSAFTTSGAAEAYVKAIDPTGKLGLKIVPDTTNTAFLVEETVKQGLVARKTALEAQILERINEATVTTKKVTKGKTKVDKVQVGAKPVPKQLTDGKPRTAGGKAVIQFEDDIDKAAFQVGSKKTPSKSDGVVKEWLQSVTGWDDAQINAHAAKVRSVVTATQNSAEDGVLLVTKQVDDGVSKAKFDLSAYEQSFDEISGSAELTKVGNVTMSSSIPQADVLNFINKLGKALGMEDRQITVLNLTDIRNSTDPNLQALVKDFETKHKGAGAVHFPKGNNRSIIVMGNRMRSETSPGIPRSKYMETFAHEYAHAFEEHFMGKYAVQMIENFNAWLKAKNIEFTGNGANLRFVNGVPAEAMIEYRSVSDASDMVYFIEKWFNGDVAVYKQYQEGFNGWARSYSEFFAENFAKWAFSDEIPTTILGQTFKKLVDGFKLIAEAVNEALASMNIVGRAGTVDVNTAKMLNDHVKLVKDQVVVANSTASALAKESKTIRPSVDVLQKELDAVTNELKGIEDAEKGLKHGWLVEQPLVKSLDYGLIGKYTDEDISSAARFALGDWALAASSEQYADRVVGMHAQSRYQKLMTEFVRPSIEKLPRSQRALLSDVLALGDKEGKVFSEVELSGLGMQKKGMDAYYRIRSLRDFMWQVRNDVASKSLTRRGYVQLDTGLPTDEGGSRIFARPTVVSNGKYVYLSDTNTMQRMSDEFRDEAIKQGYVFFEASEPVLIDGKYRKTFAFKEGAYVQNKITEVIPYRAGEFRRIYSDEYFVKIRSVRDVDGEMVEVTTTHRTAASAGDAKKYVEAMKEAQRLHKAGKLDTVAASRLMEPFGWKPEDLIEAFESARFGDDFALDVKFNRTDDDYVNETIGLSSSYSTRRGDKVLSVFGEDTVNTVNPMDSIASEIANTAYVASVTEWRESHVIRWFNTFRDELPKVVQDMDAEQAFVYMLNNKGLYIGENKGSATAQKIQEYIVSQMNVLTKEEKNYLGMMKVMSESIERIGGGGAMEKVGVALRSTKNYPTWARTVAFHSFFAFNPVQFFMQGMNSFNAIAISPIHGLASAKAAPLYAIALMSDQEEIWTQVAKVNKLTSLGLGMSTEEFVETVRTIRRSGLLDGINTTSLYGAEVGKYGIMNKPARILGQASSGFFNAGEGLSRLVSFDIARREWKAANPGGAWWADDAIVRIIERQDDLTQNMTMANTASWQKGWKSIPTQFIQYQVKLMMNIVQSLLGNSRVFTRAEAAQLLVVHSLVMGTAGNMIFPFRELIPELLPENMSEEQLLYIQQGVVAGMIGSLSDGEAQLGLGSRFNTFRYYEDLIKGILDPEKPFLEVAAGPSGFAALRIFKGVGEGISIVSKAPMSMDTLTTALNEIGKGSFSFLNNIDKYRIAKANYNRVISSSGGAMFEVSDTEAFFIAMGIPPAKQEDLSIMYESRKSAGDSIRRDAKAVGKHATLAMIALRNNDKEGYNTHRAIVQAIVGAREGEEWRTLMREANKIDSFTQYQRLLTEQAIKDWTVKDIVIDTGVPQ
jgi:hypothetical protein